MDAFELTKLTIAYTAAGAPYHEFLRRPSLSMGLYVLPVAIHTYQKCGFEIVGTYYEWMLNSHSPTGDGT